MWQDMAITITLWIFTLSVIPTTIKCLKGKNKISLYTSIPTTIGNYLLAIIWLTFPEPLTISFCSSTIMGTLWLLIAYGGMEKHTDHICGECRHQHSEVCGSCYNHMEFQRREELINKLKQEDTSNNTKFNYNNTDNNTDTTSTISDYGQEEMYQ